MDDYERYNFWHYEMDVYLKQDSLARIIRTQEHANEFMWLLNNIRKTKKVILTVPFNIGKTGNGTV